MDAAGVKNAKSGSTNRKDDTALPENRFTLQPDGTRQHG